MALPRQGGRSPYTLAVLLLSCLTLLTLDFRGFGPLETLQNGLRDALSPVRSVSEDVTSPFVDAWDAMFDYDNVKAENLDLRERVAELEGELLQVEADAGSYEALLRASDLEYLGDVETMLARVVSGPTGNFAEDTIEIDRGTGDGVKTGMGVATEAGLVGKIVEASGSRSVVQLITHPDFRIGVRLSRSDVIGVAHGVVDRDDIIRLDEGVDATIDVLDGEPVITSGGRSLFPPEIRIGRVVATDDDPRTQIRTIDVELAASTKDLTFVSVLLYEADE